MLTPEERQRLDEDGYLVLPALVDPAGVAAMRRRLEARLAETPQDHAGTLIAGGLLDDPVFDPAWCHPRILAGVRHVLGEDHRLVGVSSRGLRPGHGQQALHVDFAGYDVPPVWYGCHAICALVDFTPENGATRVIPGSHRHPGLLRRLADPRRPHPAERRLVGPAGSVFLLNVHCIHSAVQNTADAPRLALFAGFSRRDSPVLANDCTPEPSAATLARHAPVVRALLRR